MNPTLLLAASLLLAVPQFNPAYPHGPMRNTFATSAETVVDTADAIDIHANDAAFDAQMQQLHNTYDTLKAMAEDEREKDVASSLNDLVFAISACHLQARNGAPIEKCTKQIANARFRSLDALGKHKDGATWVDGPPTR